MQHWQLRTKDDSYFLALGADSEATDSTDEEDEDAKDFGLAWTGVVPDGKVNPSEVPTKYLGVLNLPL